MTNNYRKKDLRGRSFRHQNLSDADFSDADIRGADFTKANLERTNFSNVIAGVPKTWVLVLQFISLFLSIIVGLIIGFAAIFPGRLLSVEILPGKELIVFIGVIILAIFLSVLFRHGVDNRIGIVAITVVALTGILAIGINGEGQIYENLLGAVVLQPLSIAFAIVGVLVSSIVLGIIESLRNRLWLFFVGATSILGALLGSMVGGADIAPNHLAIAIAIAILEVIILLITSFYIGFRALAGDKRYSLIGSMVVHIGSWKGTNFSKANLTDADFTRANLEQTNLKEAILKRTCWFEAKNLNLSRVERTYLVDLSLRQLVTSKNGKGGFYDYKDLRGLNLKESVLIDASLIRVDLSESNLEDADMTRAKLGQARLYGANLIHANLTGACIQDWAISTDTKLDGIKCDFVYMRLPTQEDPDPWRKPDNRNETFKEGDFTDFIAPIIKTLDLYRQQNVDPRQIASTFKSLDFYHYGGIDPAAAAVAIKQLAEENPEAGLEVITLEGRGSEKIRLQAVVTGEANSSQLNAEYFEKYRKISSLPYSDIQALLAGAAEKDERIRSLEKLLGDALQQPKFYVETYQNQGEFIMAQENKGNVNISGVQGNISGIAAAGENQTMTGVALGAISGNVTNTISQLPDTTNPNEPSLKELLTQLQALIESESELNEEDKVEALEQVKVLAESGQKPEDSTLQKLAKTAVKILKGTITSLPDVTKLVESGAKLLPYITKLLGLP